MLADISPAERPSAFVFGGDYEIRVDGLEFASIVELVEHQSTKNTFSDGF
jgi:hypothetical protein